MDFSTPLFYDYSEAKAVLAARWIAVKQRTVRISWNKVSGADRYYIYMSKGKRSGKWYKYKKIKSAQTVTVK